MKKRMMGITACVVSILIACLTASVPASVPTAIPLPDRATYTTYFDTNGDEVGWRVYACNGHVSTDGTTTDDFTVLYEPCASTVQPITCASEGLSTVGSCTDWCVSPGYELSYYSDLAPDCEGNYYHHANHKR